MNNPNRGARPLYWQVADDIAQQIDSGQWNAGDKLPSERELCQRYNVSQITVRRALRELGHLDRVYSHHGLGWFVAEADPVASITQQVALITPRLDWMQSALIEALQPQLAASGVGLSLVICPGGDRLADIAAAAQENGTGALLVTPVGDHNGLTDTLFDLRRRIDIPAMAWLFGADDMPLPSVTLDEQACVQAVAHHVLTLGHRRIAFAGTDPNTLSGRNRYEGLVSLLYAQNMAVEYGWFFAGALDAPDARARFAGMLNAQPRPEVMICASDAAAAQAMRLLQDNGLSCPHDLAIVGLGDRDFAPYLPAPLTTLAFDLQSIADATARMLLQLLDGYSPRSISFTGSLVVRESCGAAS